MVEYFSHWLWIDEWKCLSQQTVIFSYHEGSHSSPHRQEDASTLLLSEEQSTLFPLLKIVRTHSLTQASLSVSPEKFYSWHQNWSQCSTMEDEAAEWLHGDSFYTLINGNRQCADIVFFSSVSHRFLPFYRPSHDVAVVISPYQTLNFPISCLKISSGFVCLWTVFTSFHLRVSQCSELFVSETVRGGTAVVFQKQINVWLWQW